MSILKNALKDSFSQIPNAIITDKRLSPLARLLYIYLAKKPDNWNFCNDAIKQELGIKDTETITKCWKSLEETGWIIREKTIPVVTFLTLPNLNQMELE